MTISKHWEMVTQKSGFLSFLENIKQSCNPGLMLLQGNTPLELVTASPVDMECSFQFTKPSPCGVPIVFKKF